jgi:hypothetical protein
MKGHLISPCHLLLPRLHFILVTLDVPYYAVNSLRFGRVVLDFTPQDILNTT